MSFTSPDRVRDVINNFNQDGFDSLYPRYAGGRPPAFTLPQRQQVKRIALSRPVDHGLPFSTSSLPTNASWLNRIECQFTALRYFTLDGTARTRSRLDDPPPLHRLAQPAHRQQGTSYHFNPRNGCLTRH